MTNDPNPGSLVDEQLSAWLDGELTEAEQQLLVNRLLASSESQARLARYDLIGSCLRGGPPGHARSELAALELGSRVRAALDGTEGVAGPVGMKRSRRLLPYALAAVVALVAVGIGLVQSLVPRPAGDAAVAGSLRASGAPSVAGDSLPVLTPVGAVSQAPLSPQRLTNYLVYHGKYSGMLSARVTESHIVNHSPSAVALKAADRFPTQ